MTRMASNFAGRPNLGPTIRARLQEAGIHSLGQLRSLGAARVYRRLCDRAGRRLPVCYYLYSLEGALRGIHWDALSVHDKARLREEAGLAARVR
jgi:DNA transformation protein and related proteins